jgi:hypothetical protein
MGLPAHHAPIGLGPSRGGTPSKSASRQIALIYLRFRRYHAYNAGRAFLILLRNAGGLQTNVTQSKRNLIFMGRILKYSIDYLKYFFTVMISFPAFPLSVEINIILCATRIYLTGELYIRSIRTKY